MTSPFKTLRPLSFFKTELSKSQGWVDSAAKLNYEGKRFETTGQKCRDSTHLVYRESNNSLSDCIG